MENEILKKNYIFIKNIEKLILKEQNITKKLNLINFYAIFIANNPSGTLHQVIIEYELMAIAENIIFSNVFKKNATKSLIIMTEAYTSGGHTRIVEHLINNSNTNSYDLVLTSATCTLPKSIIDICNKTKTNILQVDGKDFLEKASYLRNIAIEYNNIIMHIHPQDFIPILAFGHSKWNIPIFLYNHAEHRSWFGVSIVDVVMDLSLRASGNTIKYRKAQKSEILPIPLTEVARNFELNEKIRIQLNIPKDSMVFFSGGSEYKFTPNKEVDFKKYVNLILNKYSNSYFVIIGISPTLKDWQEIQHKFKQKLKIIGILEYSQYLEYINIADIYIDSMPVSGFTVLLENAMRKTPIIFLDSSMSFMESILKEKVNNYDVLGKIDEVISNDFKQNIDLSNHLLANFIMKHDQIVNENQIHRVNLNIEEVIDFDKKSFMSFILFTVYKNKLYFPKRNFLKISIKYKFYILFYILRRVIF